MFVRQLNLYPAARPKRMLDAYVADYLREEVAAEGLVRNLPTFSEFLDIAALSDGEIVNFSSIARECGVSSHTGGLPARPNVDCGGRRRRTAVTGDAPRRSGVRTPPLRSGRLCRYVRGPAFSSAAASGGAWQDERSAHRWGRRRAANRPCARRAPRW